MFGYDNGNVVNTSIMELIEKYIFNGKGYSPLLISDGWQVAFLNYAETEALESIDKLDIHFKTDEAFVLLSGSAVLIAANIVEDNISYDIINMKEGVIYNIPVNTWHKIAMYPESKVCIIEKSQTHLSDFEFYYLSNEQKRLLREEVNHCIEE